MSDLIHDPEGERAAERGVHLPDPAPDYCRVIDWLMPDYSPPEALIGAGECVGCEMWDDGDGESGPHLAISLDERCPVHGWLDLDDMDLEELLALYAPGGPQPGEMVPVAKPDLDDYSGFAR